MILSDSLLFIVVFDKVAYPGGIISPGPVWANIHGDSATVHTLRLGRSRKYLQSRSLKKWNIRMFCRKKDVDCYSCVRSSVRVFDSTDIGKLQEAKDPRIAWNIEWKGKHHTYQNSWFGFIEKKKITTRFVNAKIDGAQELSCLRVWMGVCVRAVKLDNESICCLLF